MGTPMRWEAPSLAEAGGGRAAVFHQGHGIDPRRLIANGHGKTQLLLPEDPNNERNRRVQFENPHYAEAAAVTRPAPTAQTPPARTPAEAPGPDGM
jgi:hypothetical protein